MADPALALRPPSRFGLLLEHRVAVRRLAQRYDVCRQMLGRYFVPGNPVQQHRDAAMSVGEIVEVGSGVTNRRVGALMNKGLTSGGAQQQELMTDDIAP